MKVQRISGHVGGPMPHRAISLGLKPDEYRKLKKGEIVDIDEKYIPIMKRSGYVDIIENDYPKESATLNKEETK